MPDQTRRQWLRTMAGSVAGSVAGVFIFLMIAILPGLERLAYRYPSVLVDAVTDPNEPMLPPKRREEYMKHFGKAFDIGTPGQGEIEQRLKEEPASTSLKA